MATIVAGLCSLMTASLEIWLYWLVHSHRDMLQLNLPSQPLGGMAQWPALECGDSGMVGSEQAHRSTVHTFQSRSVAFVKFSGCCATCVRNVNM
jgi:hypothetical protein